MPVAFILGAMAGLALVYGIAPLSRNAAPEAACRPAAEAAKRLEPYARGEVAALTPAKAPIRVSDLTFRDGNDVQLQSKAGQPLARYFPEIVEP